MDESNNNRIEALKLAYELDNSKSMTDIIDRAILIDSYLSGFDIYTIPDKAINSKARDLKIENENSNIEKFKCTECNKEIHIERRYIDSGEIYCPFCRTNALIWEES